MDLPAAYDEPLAQPSRARLFAALIELRRPAGTELRGELVDEGRGRAAAVASERPAG